MKCWAAPVHSKIGFSESGDALIQARRIKYREIQRQRLSYPKRLGRMIGKIIVGQAMHERPEPTGLDSPKD